MVHKGEYIGSSIDPLTQETIYSPPCPVLVFEIPFTAAERSRFSKFKRDEYTNGNVSDLFSYRSIISRPVEGKIAIDFLVDTVQQEPLVFDMAIGVESRYLATYPTRI